jgi:hypothetical protein
MTTDTLADKLSRETDRNWRRSDGRHYEAATSDVDTGDDRVVLYKIIDRLDDFVAMRLEFSKPQSFVPAHKVRVSGPDPVEAYHELMETTDGT